MTYAAKAKLVTYALPLVVILLCVFAGYSATHSLLVKSSSTPVGVSMALGQTEYTVGQDVTLTLSNASKTAIYVVNRCPSDPLMVYRKKANTWVSVVATTNTSRCVGEPYDYKIAANTSKKINYCYWPGLFKTAGTYRIVAPIESFGGGPTVTFTVKQ